MTYADGREYKGFFKDGKKSSLGTLIFTDGKKYEGQFKNDEMDGQGIDGHYVYLRLFMNDGGHYNTLRGLFPTAHDGSRSALPGRAVCRGRKPDKYVPHSLALDNEGQM